MNKIKIKYWKQALREIDEYFDDERLEGVAGADRMPKRIQRKRTKGWRMPPGAVYVGRPSQWGNPFRAHDGECDHPECNGHPPATAADAVAAFRRWVTPEYSERVRRELRGKDLACWCPPGAPCHADVLLELANT